VDFDINVNIGSQTIKEFGIQSTKNLLHQLATTYKEFVIDADYKDIGLQTEYVRMYQINWIQKDY
jgi:hypothetical protein